MTAENRNRTGPFHLGVNQMEVSVFYWLTRFRMYLQDVHHGFAIRAIQTSHLTAQRPAPVQFTSRLVNSIFKMEPTLLDI
jgi:hypothetical protein